MPRPPSALLQASLQYILGIHVTNAHLIPIGYFTHNTIPPSLLTSPTVHDEVAAILYRENVFGFHISGLGVEKWVDIYLNSTSREDNHPFGVSVFAPRYRPLVKKIWVRTEHQVHDCGGRDWGEGRRMHARDPYPIDHTTAALYEKGKELEIILKKADDLAASMALMKCVWRDELFGIGVNTTDVVVLRCGKYNERREGRERWRDWREEDWPAGGGHLWKMVVIGDGERGIRREFRRVVWRRKKKGC
ncbi:MAG: hypothetical protein Q9164_001543 [Protoblastenia rupestris]